jgi:hypothetical protein
MYRHCHLSLCENKKKTRSFLENDAVRNIKSSLFCVYKKKEEEEEKKKEENKHKNNEKIK